jgi:hypothetical protein
VTEYHNQDPLETPNSGERWVVYRVISRYSWDVLQDLAKCREGSSVEHLEHGLYLLRKPPCPCDAKKRPALCRPAKSNPPTTRRLA